METHKSWQKLTNVSLGFPENRRVLFGTAGLKILGSDDAKKVYTNCTAAGMRAKDTVMQAVNTVQENVGDIVAEAEQINEERQEAKEAAEIKDAAEETEADA